MTQIHTTERPSQLVDVDPAELESLTRQHLIYSLGLDLQVTYLTWSDGAPADIPVTASVSITNEGGGGFGTGGFGTSPFGEGAPAVAVVGGGQAVRTITGWTYRWRYVDQPGPGTYTLYWSATDGRTTGVATQIIVVDPLIVPVSAGAAAGVGAANTAAALRNVPVSAGTAAGTGTAPSIGPAGTAGGAAGVAAAATPAVTVSAPAGAATGTGAAQTPAAGTGYGVDGYGTQPYGV